jgi:exodeoxyribonuclease V alpha subunit
VLSADDMLVEIADAMAPDKPVLGQRLAVLAVSAWRSASSEAALVAWLDRLGVPDLGVVRRLHRVFGDVAMERIAANPYVMVPLLPWKRTDAIGKRLILEDGGDPAGDRRRIVGAADEAVKQMLRRGDTASSARDFGMETANLLALPLVADAAVTIAAETGLCSLRATFCALQAPPHSKMISPFACAR